MDITQLLAFAVKNRASDLHLSAGLPPMIRVHGDVRRLNVEALDHERVHAMVYDVMNDAQRKQFEETLECDFSFEVPGLSRFRVNAFNQQRGAGAVFRAIPSKVLTLEQLATPALFADLALRPRGLVLVTGPTGSGKSTTLAAIIDQVNTHSARHIITIEDPVEFVHPNKMSTLSQREVGVDTKSFANALRSAIRQDPGVILVGEMRDMETIALAITAAEMGVLVFGTLHTNSAPKTIDRVIDAFPTDQQQQVRTMLSESLAAVVSQLLLKTPDGRGRVAVPEILLKTPGLPNDNREGNTPMISSIIQSGKGLGMQSMDDVLFRLATEKKIAGEDAFHKATNKARFESMAEDHAGGH